MQLPRVITGRALALTMITITVGAGVFGLPAQAAHELGAAAILGYIVCCVVVGAVGLCFAEAGSRVSAPGGLYAYSQAAFGPTAASVSGVLVLIADGAVPSAAIAVLLVTTLALVFPFLAEPLPRAAFLVLVYGIVTFVNVRGARNGARLSQVVTVIKLLPLIALVVLGLPHVQMENLTWTGFPELSVLGRTSVILFFAFMGFESALAVSGEVTDPERTVPRALFGALALVMALYIGIQVVAQGVLGPALATSGASPLGETARAIFGDTGAQVIIWATILSTAGVIAGDGLSSPRTVHALATDGFLPRSLAAIHPAHQTPYRSIIAYNVVCLSLALTGSFQSLVVFGAAGVLAMYLISSLAVLGLRKRGVRGEREPFVIPGGAAVPLFAVAVICLLLYTLAVKELLAVAGLIAAAVVMRLFLRPARA